jgi:non-ribosomal peptide synthetase component F
MPRTSLPHDHASLNQRSFDAGVVDVVVPRALTEDLRGVAASHNTTVYAVVLSSIFALLYRHTGQQDLVIGTQVSGRSHPALENQIGCYINTLVLRAGVHGTDTPGRLIQATTRVLRDALEHQNYPFDRLVDELRVATPHGRSPLFDIQVDYVPGLNVQSPEYQDAGIQAAEMDLHAESAQYDLSFLIVESDELDRISVRIVFNSRLFEARSILPLHHRLITILRWLTAGTPTTISEIDLTGTGAAAPSRRVRVQLNIG